MKSLKSSWMDDPLVAKYKPRFDGSAADEPLTFEETKELFDAFLKLNERLLRIIKISDSYQSEVKDAVLELQNALANVKTLKGLIPICASCKRIRNHHGCWKQLEQYIVEHSDALFSHGLCPECSQNYRALAMRPERESSRTPSNPAQMLDEMDMEDPVIIRFLPTLNNPHYTASPLYSDFSALFQKYVRLTKRMRRIVRISDSYQSQLHELKIRLDRSSRSDCLTGLSNRRDMYDKLKTELSRSQRHSKTFALVMMDFDHFKQINDTYGHEVGDRVLMEAAQSVRDNLRQEDSCCRWGGEEFLLLFPETNQVTAVHISEKLRRLIAGISIDASGTEIRLTASLGVAIYQPGETIAECIKRADEALYEAKNKGRNRSILHTEA